MTPTTAQNQPSVTVSGTDEIRRWPVAGTGYSVAPNGAHISVEDGVEIGQRVTIGNGTSIDRGSRIGSGTTISSGCHIAEGVEIGEVCNIEQAIVMPNCSIGDGVHLGQGLMLFDGVTLGPGVSIPFHGVIPSGVTWNISPPHEFDSEGNLICCLQRGTVIVQMGITMDFPFDLCDESLKDDLRHHFEIDRKPDRSDEVFAIIRRVIDSVEAHPGEGSSSVGAQDPMDQFIQGFQGLTGGGAVFS